MPQLARDQKCIDRNPPDGTPVALSVCLLHIVHQDPPQTSIVLIESAIASTGLSALSSSMRDSTIRVKPLPSPAQGTGSRWTPSVRHQGRGTLATSSQRYWKKFICRQRLSMVSWTPHEALQTGHWKCSPGTFIETTSEVWKI